MKKLQKLLLVLCFIIGILSNTYAQVPIPDATQTGVVAGGSYTYTVPNPAEQSWTWTVINSAGTVITPGADYAMVDVQDYEKKITWNTNGTYYIKVVTTNTTTFCTNEYAIQVDVASNDYAVAFNTSTEDTYCADDANIAAGMEITLDITLGGSAPAATYYGMEVQYTVDSGATQTATIGTDNKFNIPTMDVVDPVSPAFTSVTVTIVQVKDINGVTFTPLAANADYVITVNPTPAKPVINF